MADTTINPTATTAPQQDANPYMYMNNQQTMTNDVFGSKYYNNFNNNAAATANLTQQAPANKAQSIFQQYCAATGATGTGAPTMQDYYMASQIAGMYSGNNQMPFAPTSFMQNDVFAQSHLNPYCA